MIPSCAVIGDSIAVGMAHAMPWCEARTIGGASAMVFDRRFSGATAGIVIISLGSDAGPDDVAHLRGVRAKVTGAVVWLAPPGRPSAREIIGIIAAEHGDRIVDVRLSDATPRHIHPSAAGYRRLVALITEKDTP
jgi:hypothetical protein